MQYIRLPDLVAWVRAFLLTPEYQGLDAALQEPLLILAALIFAGGGYFVSPYGRVLVALCWLQCYPRGDPLCYEWLAAYVNASRAARRGYRAKWAYEREFLQPLIPATVCTKLPMINIRWCEKILWPHKNTCLLLVCCLG